MANVFSRIISEDKQHFLELWYDGFDMENPLEYALCSVDLFHRREGCWVGSDYKWSDYKGIRDRYTEPSDENYVRALKEIERKGGVVLPVYCYEHGGVTFRCSSFSDPWDSGQVGYAYMTTEQIIQLGWPKGKRGRKAAAEEYIRNMVGLMAAWANGDSYGFSIYDKDGGLVDSCGGFYDSHYGKVDWIGDMKVNVAEEFHPLFDEYHNDPGRIDDLEYSRRIPQSDDEWEVEEQDDITGKIINSSEWGDDHP